MTADHGEGGAAGDRRNPAPAAGGLLAADGLDAPAAGLLRRAQNAVGAVTSAEIFRHGLLDEPTTTAALAAQQAEIAEALREPEN